MVLYFCAYSLLIGAFAAWLPTYLWFVWKCDYLERRGASRYFLLQKQIEGEIAKAYVDRYATLLEDEKTEGYLAGLQMALELTEDASAEKNKSET